MTNRKPPEKPLNQYARFSGILFQMIAIIGIGAFLGVKLDERYPNPYHLYTLVLTVLFVLIAMYVTIRQIVKTSRKDE